MSPRACNKLKVPFLNPVERINVAVSLTANLQVINSKYTPTDFDEVRTVVDLLEQKPEEWCKAFAILWKTQPEVVENYRLFNVRKRRTTAYLTLYVSLSNTIGINRFRPLQEKLRDKMFDLRIIDPENLGNRPYFVRNSYPKKYYEFEMPAKSMTVSTEDDPFA